MFSAVNYSVKLKDGVTPLQSYIRLKQGCNLSPTLYNIFINDIPNLFNQSCDPVRLDNTDLSCLLYADDLILLNKFDYLCRIRKGLFDYSNFYPCS